MYLSGVHKWLGNWGGVTAPPPPPTTTTALLSKFVNTGMISWRLPVQLPCDLSVSNRHLDSCNTVTSTLFYTQALPYL